MKLIGTSLPGVYEAETVPNQDPRGQFARIFCNATLAEAQGCREIVQINHSVTRAVGTVRGLHFQRPPRADAKWVRCLRGRVWDVAVDLRRGSPTFLRWHAIELSADLMNAVFIPEGCAHGFQVLEPGSELLYLHTAAYSQQYEGAVRWDDRRLMIGWPLLVDGLSERDRNHPPLDDDFEGIAI
jgi:dTDP-4-dehydrorhamnose 3,5-epimerase